MRSPATCCENERGCLMANSRMTFCKVCGFKECHHISRLFVSASSEPLDKLAIIADKVSGGCWCVLDYLCCHNCSSTIPVIFMQCSANHGLSRQTDPRAVSQVAELTRERNSSRHQRYSSDRRRSHSRSRSVNRGWHLLLSSPL
ncbi:hypothetical protein TNCV_890911 [Trichonephila clavipes]|nr:hypothetical protein TNCV_890911 [Trichonephila clavipes]